MHSNIEPQQAWHASRKLRTTAARNDISMMIHHMKTPFLIFAVVYCIAPGATAAIITLDINFLPGAQGFTSKIAR